MISKDLFKTSTTGRRESTTPHASGNLSKELVGQGQSGTDQQALDEKVKSMMGKGQRMIPNGKQANGTPKQETSSICNVCGKEGRPQDIRKHIEANHIEGVTIPCDFCNNSFQTRSALGQHKIRNHT